MVLGKHTWQAQKLLQCYILLMGGISGAFTKQKEVQINKKPEPNQNPN